jgi:cytochrome oxidase assembly protein ShyY1
MSENPTCNGSGMGTVLRQRRWVGLTILIVILVPTFVLLGRWQWHRYEWRSHLNAGIEAGLQAPAKPILSVAEPGAQWNKDNRYAHVIVTGTYDAAGQQLVRKRPLNASNGFYVVTPLTLTRGGTVLVARGWIAAGSNAHTTPPVSPPPTGTVTVNGWFDEPDKNPGPRPSDMPDGQIAAAYPGSFGPTSQVVDGVVVLISSQPAQANDITVLPLPELGSGPHISYMIQWFCFALLAIGGWWVLLRRDVKEHNATNADTPGQ